MDVADVEALGAHPPDRLMDRPEGRSPADDDKRAALLAQRHRLRRDMRGDAVDLGLACVGHHLMVGRRIIDVAGALGLLDPADPVEQPWRARLDPRPLALVVTAIRQEGLPLRWRIGAEAD